MLHRKGPKLRKIKSQTLQSEQNLYSFLKQHSCPLRDCE